LVLENDSCPGRFRSGGRPSRGAGRCCRRAECSPAGTRTSTLNGGITAQLRGGKVEAFRCKNRDSGGLDGKRLKKLIYCKIQEPRTSARFRGGTSPAHRRVVMSLFRICGIAAKIKLFFKVQAFIRERGCWHWPRRGTHRRFWVGDGRPTAAGVAYSHYKALRR